ncbi:hypothetical protein PGTUg99_016609 [Puccinia graminis f. sp. tritici]|uniref:Uncharacterized protein n=1 Tax=Puccinia graminis f. sp. tritici TaxID=56615 RepID=A0A5B0RA41_PUCGR|nr:hypothetical protein PGTUg99_016609 [Puccinia graminis f. sp. tritici]
MQWTQAYRVQGEYPDGAGLKHLSGIVTPLQVSTNSPVSEWRPQSMCASAAGSGGKGDDHPP